MKKLSRNAFIPNKAYQSDAGFDLHADEDVILPPFQRKLIYTNIQIYLPRGCYGRIAPRSGLALSHGIDVMGGVIDRGYSGNIGVILINLSDAIYNITKGDRIAQLIIEKIFTPFMIEVVNFPVTKRHNKGFGSSGK